MNKRKETFIGFRDPERYNSIQYNAYANKYTESNPLGLRGGLTPAERVAILGKLAPSGSRVFEIGFGPGHDALELVKARYRYRGGDISYPFIDNLIAEGLDAFYYDAAKDPIPTGIDVVYAHLSLYHIRPDALVRLLANCRERLEDPRAFFASFLDGHGHERSERSEEFSRDFIYYPKKRLEQMCTQEGLNLKFIERVIAFNGTAFWHIGGVFTKEYKGGSYGKEGLSPFGEVIWTPRTLYRKESLMHDLMEAQNQAGLLDRKTINKVKRYENLFDRNIISISQLAREVNTTWASGLAGQDIKVIMQHAKEYFTQKLRVRILTETAFAVCNNNGFKNILAGIEPSWLMKVLADHLNIDRLESAQWQTETGAQFEGTITGGVFYSKNNADPGRPIINYQERLRNLLGPQYKRITIGVGHSKLDDALLENTDYPIYAYPDQKTFHLAHYKDAFRDSNGQLIHSTRDEIWLRWAPMDTENKLIKYLNMITSGRFPIEPNPEFNGHFWVCPDNTLNCDFYKANQVPVHIL